MTWLSVLGSVTSAWRTHPVQLQASYLCDSNLRGGGRKSEITKSVEFFKIWKYLHYLQRRKRLRTSQEILSVWCRQRNRKFNAGPKEQSPRWRLVKGFKMVILLPSSSPSLPREWKVESPARKKSSQHVPLRRSQRRTPLKPDNWSFHWTFVQNYHVAWYLSFSSVIINHCGHMPFLPHLLLFGFYMKLSRIWVYKACINTCMYCKLLLLTKLTGVLGSCTIKGVFLFTHRMYNLSIWKSKCIVLPQA